MDAMYQNAYTASRFIGLDHDQAMSAMFIFQDPSIFDDVLAVQRAKDAEENMPPFEPTHESSAGEPLILNPDEPGTYLNEAGDIVEDDWATPIENGEPESQPEPEPTATYAIAMSGGKNFGEVPQEVADVCALKAWAVRVPDTILTGADSYQTSKYAQAANFASNAKRFIQFIAQNFTKAYKPRGSGFYLSVETDNGATALVLIDESPSGSFYDVKSTFAGKQTNSVLAGARLIWEKPESEGETDPSTLIVNRQEYGVFGGDGETVKIPLPNQEQINAFYRFAWRADEENQALRGQLRDVTEIAEWISKNLLPEGETLTGNPGNLRKALGIWSGKADKYAGLSRMTEEEARAKVSAIEAPVTDEDLPTSLASSITSEEQVKNIELSSGMDDSLDPNSPNYKYRDTGYIAGSAKEKAAERIKQARLAGELLRSKDIDWDAIEENPREAQQLITKGNIMGKPDWDTLKESGMTPQAAFLIDKVYRAVATSPANDTPEMRKAFVTGIESLRDRLEKLKTAKEVFAFLDDEVHTEMTQPVYTLEEQERRDHLNAEIKAQQQASRDIQSRHGWSSPEAQEASRKVRDLIGNRDRLDKEVRARNERENAMWAVWGSLGRRFEDVVKRRSAAFVKHLKASLYRNTPSNWDWTTTTKADGTAAPKQPRFKLIVSNNYERVGGRNIGVDSTPALKEQFGLRDIQSGNWVLKDKASAEFHVKRSAEAFADLADVLGVDDKRVSIGGKLAIAFGARGHSGALAHYEPVQRVINMTKMSGGGSLAHEWFHAFDNLLIEFMGEGVSGAQHKDFLTESPHTSKNPVVQSAFNGLRDAMTKGDVREKLGISYSTSDVQLAKQFFDRQPTQMARKIAEAGSFQAAVDYLETGVRWGRDRQTREKYYRLTAAWYGGEEAEGMTMFAGIGMGYSKFYRDAVFLDGGKRGKYWSTSLEMAARAFSAYVEDRLRDSGRKNDYLSNHSSNEDPEYISMGARPFPEGEERKTINAAFDKLFASLRENAIFDSLMTDI